MLALLNDPLENLRENGAFLILSSPLAKPAGPKGLRAESARAVTGWWCPHSGEGEDFLTRQPGFFFLQKQL